MSKGRHRAQDREDQRRIAIYSCYYGRPERFNPRLFGAALGHYPCFVFSDDANLAVPDGAVLIHDPLIGLDANRASRRAKLMPHRYVPNCDWSIYIDNNAVLSADPGNLITDIKGIGDCAIFATRHRERNCIYQEAEACISLSKDKAHKITEQMAIYRKCGFPENAGLIHAAFLVRNHNHPDLALLGDHWFEHVLAYSRRDQLSFPFVAQTLDIEVGDLSQDAFPDWPLFEWPVYYSDDRWDSKDVEQKSEPMNILKRLFGRKPKKSMSDKIKGAEEAVAELYRDRIGEVVVEGEDGHRQVKFEKDGQFDYETYRDIQNTGNKLKIDHQWVGETQIGLLAGMVKEFAGPDIEFGICHGTRRGNEQRWFRDVLGSNVKVIGTDIADTAADFPDTIQWDFHQVNPDWVNKADFVYSNSWDHSYDPLLAMGVWIGSLRPGGIMLLDWSEGHSVTGASEMDPFGVGLQELIDMIDKAFAQQGSVVTHRKGDRHATQQIWTVVFQKNPS